MLLFSLQNWNRISYTLARKAFLNCRSSLLRMDSPSFFERDGKKRLLQENASLKKQKKQKKQKAKQANKGESSEEILLTDIRNLLAVQGMATESTVLPITDRSKEDSINSDIPKESETNLNDMPHEKTTTESLPGLFSEIEVRIQELSSTGDGLAFHPPTKRIYVVPFTAPGDTVKVKIYKHFAAEQYSMADFVSVVEQSPLRDDSRIKCKYFAKCSGCQLQMLDYAIQLEHKKRVVEKAYKHFSDLPPEMIPMIQDTMGSPMQYGYRTKLTPHFDAPPGARRNKNGEHKAFFTQVPPIGFMQKGTRRTIDIEDCPIGTDAVRMGMKKERSRIAEELQKYKRGATILLRESTKRLANDSEEAHADAPPDAIKSTTPTHIDSKTCITDNNATSTEYVDDFTFTNPAGSFFQNNNSILPSFTSYIRAHALPPNPTHPKLTHLIDAYSGSGLFTITLSSLFASSTGIDISTSSITSARHNASLNNLPASRCSFMAADASRLFEDVKFPPSETVVVIDPPRKGCDEGFLRQLLGYAPKRVVYVSCNVHTQARDVGVLVRGVEGSWGGGEGQAGGGSKAARYEIESIRGFDFFPQTGHVEAVAILNRVEEMAA